MPSKNGNPTLSDMQSPLCLHPSDGPHTGTIAEKLAGPSNYRAWRRGMEIVLASKRKLGFVTGLVKRDPEDAKKQHQWDTGNSMVIAWMKGSMTNHVKESVMKYKLNKAVYDLKQKEKTVTEYYTAKKSLWDELDAMSNLPPITTMTPEVQAFVTALNKEREEERLFQFLNGLENDYGSERSHVLMFTPLPSVEEACARFVQDEAQREVLKQERVEVETGAMMSRRTEGCEVCGLKGHTKDKCWKVVGYPKWHPKHKKMQRGETAGMGPRWNKGKQTEGGNKWAGNAQTENEVNVAADKLEKIMKLAPTVDPGDEAEPSFAGMTCCCNGNALEDRWIMDTGATNHMTGNSAILFEREPVNPKQK
ncbi:putative transposase y4uI [Bienertia sinuspersici]